MTAPTTFPAVCGCGCGRQVNRSTWYRHARTARDTALHALWMAVEQQPTRPAPAEPSARQLTHGEHMPEPQTWEQWLATRGQQTSEGR